ncbi:transposase [Bradyrhizobium sp. TZ2]
MCIDARHAKAALRMQINKSDRNDAVGIASIMQCGWYKEVRVKDLDSHAVKALLVSRALLVKIKRDLENQVRGLLKNPGLVIGPAKMNAFALRAAELTKDQPELAAAVTPLLNARVAIEQQIAGLDRKVMRLARSNAQLQRFMTAPGIGPVTALCFLATIDDPTRFRRSRSVGAAVTPFPHPARRTGLANLSHPALGQDLTPSPTACRAQARLGVRARSARRGARVDTSRPCVA